MFESTKNHPQEHGSKKFKTRHFLFLEIWLCLLIFFGFRYGVTYFIIFPYNSFFSPIIVVWFLVGIIYLGVTFANWRFKKIGLSILIGLIVIPIGFILQNIYLNNSEERALRNFITYTRNGEFPNTYIIDDLEGVKCFAEDLTPTYKISSDFFFGVYDWWIKLENGKTYTITTYRKNLTTWEVTISCPYQRD